MGSSKDNKGEDCENFSSTCCISTAFRALVQAEGGTERCADATPGYPDTGAEWRVGLSSVVLSANPSIVNQGVHRPSTLFG